MGDRPIDRMKDPYYANLLYRIESAKEIASSPDKARAVLQDAVILIPKGNFSKHYRSGERKLGTAKH